MPPVRVGVLAFVHADADRPFGEQTTYIRGLLRAGRELGLVVFAFGPQDVDLERRSIRAYVLAGNGRRWRRVRRRYPDVVYDRFFLHLPQREVLRRYRRIRRQAGFRFLNPSLPDKWRLHRYLRRVRSVRHLLPPTLSYRDSGQLARWLRRWRRVVVKPRSGMKGQGIWFLRRAGDHVIVRSGTGGGRRLPAGALAEWAAAHLRGRLLVQPELHLRDASGRPFDIRVLIQRDGAGKLDVTGVAVRVGRAGSRVANLHRGGTALTAAEAVRKLPGVAEAAAALPEGSLEGAAREAALRVTAAIEARCGACAELGIDLGLDLARRRLVFLEANSRPGRLVFRKSGNHRARALSVRRPLEYARFLVQGGRGETGKEPARGPAPSH